MQNYLLFIIGQILPNRIFKFSKPLSDTSCLVSRGGQELEPIHRAQEVGHGD